MAYIITGTRGRGTCKQANEGGGVLENIAYGTLLLLKYITYVIKGTRGRGTHKKVNEGGGVSENIGTK